MDTTTRIEAVSYHRDLDGLHGRLAVQRVFSRACHLRDANGWVITVGTAPYDGPLAVRLDLPGLEGMGMQPGTEAVLDDHALSMGPVTISLAGANRWTPPGLEDAPPLFMSALRRDVESLAAAVAVPSPPNPLSHAGRGGVLKGIVVHGPPLPRWERGQGERGGPQGLLSAILDEDQAQIEHHAHKLIGLGPGLTPAGDDLLCGLLAGLRILGGRRQAGYRPSEEPKPWAARQADLLGAAVDRIAPERTTALSRTLLFYASRMVAVEPLLDVLCTVGSGGSIRNLEALVGIGHTSGRDMLAGAVLAARALLEKVGGSTLVCPA